MEVIFMVEFLKYNKKKFKIVGNLGCKYKSYY